MYNTISGLMTIPEGRNKCPCVILSHGLVSSKESSKYVALSELLVQEGIASCRFDYHGCGQSSGNIKETTLTIRLENLDKVVEHVLADNRINCDKLGLLGSSFGGTTSVLKAARDRRIKCLSFWATPHTIEKTPDGTISDIQFGDTLYSDFTTYDILTEAGRVSRALGIHGEMDNVVPFQEGKTIYENMKRPKKFELIRQADHVFSDPGHRERASRFALGWFKKFL